MNRIYDVRMVRERTMNEMSTGIARAFHDFDEKGYVKKWTISIMVDQFGSRDAGWYNAIIVAEIMMEEDE